MKAKINQISIHIAQGDLLAQEAAAIVNVTDTTLTLPPRLASLAGDATLQAIQHIGWCAVGSAVITTAGQMEAEKLIHAVSPRWGEGTERGRLANLTWEVLHLAETHAISSVAMPAIGAGVFGYPIEYCAKVMLEEVINFTFEILTYLQRISICLETEVETTAFIHEFKRQLSELKNDSEARVS